MAYLSAFHAGQAYGFTVFDTEAKKSTDIKSFKKWVRVLERQPKEIERVAQRCDEEECGEKSWKLFLTELKKLTRRDQLTEVNRYLNQSPYIRDIINWGEEDYWETLPEFFDVSGDCEDYAMAKYVALKYAGFDEENMRIIILNDENLDALHAVLAVSLKKETYILDNQIEDVMKDSRIHHYSPIYSINENAWWRHVSN